MFVVLVVFGLYEPLVELLTVVFGLYDPLTERLVDVLAVALVVLVVLGLYDPLTERLVDVLAVALVVLGLYDPLTDRLVRVLLYELVGVELYELRVSVVGVAVCASAGTAASTVAAVKRRRVFMRVSSLREKPRKGWNETIPCSQA